MACPTITLNNGNKMPIVGLGTWASPVGQVRQAVKDAIDAGYRHIDCAYVYENEHEVGEGISEKIAEGVIKREDVFVTSKLWNNFHDPKLVREAFDITLKNLKLDYLDLYLIHWPIGYEPSRTELFPKKADGSPAHTNFDLVDTYHALEELVDAGLTKSIGVSNFSIKQITRIVEAARIKPVVNQFECHPYLLNKALREYCKNNNVVVTAYSPLGSPGRSYATADDPVVLEEPKVLTIAEKYKKTPAQILIRFQIQLGNIVIPKSVTKERIISNFNVFDFELTDADMNDLQSFQTKLRCCALTQDVNHPDYPFHED